ncbi:MAG: RHS repeat-associated core domain-containing protein [Adhaeribacter sp.]
MIVSENKHRGDKLPARSKAAETWPAKAGLLLLLVLGLLQPGRAQNITRPNIAGPAGLQVNSYSGNLFFQRTDLQLPGRGPALEMTFSYNSAMSHRDWGFGFGWTHNYNQQYQPDPNGVVMLYADGREDLFWKKGEAYVPPKGVFHTLEAYETSKFKLKAKDGTTYFFENPEHKKLTRIQDRNGNELILEYIGSQLSKLTDGAGRSLTLTWLNNTLAHITDANGAAARIFSFEYNGAGCLVSVQNPRGDKINYTYGVKRRLNGLTDANGNAVNLTYNDKGAVTRLVTCSTDQSITYNATLSKTFLIEKGPDKQLITTYAFDAEGRLTERAGNCCGFKNTFTYDGNNNISTVTDANGGTTTYWYDAMGNLKAESDVMGVQTRYTYEPVFNQISGITDKNGHQTFFSYDGKGNLTGVTHPLNITESFTYAGNGDRLSFTNGRGGKITYTYDKYGHLASLTDAEGGGHAFSYDPAGNLLQWTDANKGKTSFSYNTLNQLLSLTNALGGTTRFTYDANGNQLTTTDARGNTTSYEYDDFNRPFLKKDALGNVSMVSYNPFGTVSSRTDAAGHTTRFEYDNLNRLVAQVNAANERTAFTRDGNGNITSITYPNGNTLSLQYDAGGRLTSLADRLGMIAAYTYDRNANKLSEMDAAGNTSTFQYDAMGRLVARQDALGNAYTFAYDDNGNLTRQTDRNGNSSTYTFDAANRQLTAADALGHVTSYSYDKSGNLVSVKDANNNVTAYTYDLLDRLTQEKFADNTTRTYAYDGVGNLLSRTDNQGQVSNYVYDKLHRLTTRTYPNSTETFTYDAAGRMLTATNQAATVVFTYDPLGRVLSETLNGKATRYSYNAAAGTKTITYPGGRKIEQSTNERNLLKALKEDNQVLAEFSYDGQNRLTGRRYANNTTLNQAFTANNRVASLSHGPTQFVDLAYTYDKENNPLTAVHKHRAAQSDQYGYDKINQLKEFRRGSSLQAQFNYDGVGNRTTANLNGTAATFAVNSMNAYSSITAGEAQNLNYDANGNLTADGEHSFSYDSENRLTSIDNGTTAQYAYDALGRRIRKIVGSTTSHYYYDWLQLIEERNELDAVEATYVYGTWLDDILSMTRDGNPYYYHHNAIGSVVAITNKAGAVVERYDYDAFGNLTIMNGAYGAVSSSAVGNAFTFTGRQFDAETGFYDYRLRFYDPSQGRFLQRDPIGFYGNSINLYSYVNNKPIKYIDPFGTKGVPSITNLCNTANNIDDTMDNVDVRVSIVNGEPVAGVASFAGDQAGTYVGTAVGAYIGSQIGLYSTALVVGVFSGPGGFLTGPIAGAAIGAPVGAAIGGTIGGLLGGFIGGEIAGGIAGGNKSDGSDIMEIPKPPLPGVPNSPYYNKAQEVINNLPPVSPIPDLRPIGPAILPAPFSPGRKLY